MIAPGGVGTAHFTLLPGRRLPYPKLHRSGSDCCSEGSGHANITAMRIETFCVFPPPGRPLDEAYRERQSFMTEESIGRPFSGECGFTGLGERTELYPKWTSVLDLRPCTPLDCLYLIVLVAHVVSSEENALQVFAMSQARRQAKQGAGNLHDQWEPSMESILADWFMTRRESPSQRYWGLALQVARFNCRRLLLFASVSLAAMLIAAAVARHYLSGRYHLEPDEFLTHVVQWEGGVPNSHSQQAVGWCLTFLGRDDEVRTLDFNPRLKLPSKTADLEQWELHVVPWTDGIEKLAADNRIIMITDFARSEYLPSWENASSSAPSGRRQSDLRTQSATVVHSCNWPTYSTH